MNAIRRRARLAAQSAEQALTTAHDFSFQKLNEEGAIDLSEYAGKVVLIVNVASQCGFTPQYRELEALWQAKANHGLVIIGVPSNDFGHQERGSEAEIAAFCDKSYRVTFPMTAKAEILGANRHPFYQWIAREVGADALPRWNFHKFLIGKDGALSEDVTVRLDPGTGPITHTFRANSHLTAWDVTVIADAGDILDYPFDRYRFDFDCEAFVKDKPVTLVAGLGAVPHGIRAKLTDIRGQGTDDDISIEIRRSGSVIFLAALSTISLLVVAIAALSVAWQVAEQGRKIDFSMMTWVAAFMFVIPAVRSSLPGAPPVGALIDFILFFWLQVLAAVATTTLVVIWMKQKPNA